MKLGKRHRTELYPEETQVTCRTLNQKFDGSSRSIRWQSCVFSGAGGRPSGI